MIKQSILETIGNTPVVKINNLGPKDVNLYVKMESFNPLSSVKDRLALGVIEAAEKDGSLKPGQTVIEATSGNTGIGLAMVCAQKGYPLVIVMAENFSEERRKLLRFLGAKVVLTPAWAKGSGMKVKVEELAKKHGWFMCKQFENPANAEMHTRTTAKEIADDFAEVGLDYWISGYGTGGTLSGVAKGLKSLSPKTKIMVAEPDNIQILKQGIPQPDTPNVSHPHARPHPIQGWTPDFIPELLDQSVVKNVDGFLPVNGKDAFKYSKLLAQKEGVFVGISAGATFAAMLKLAEQVPSGSNLLCMLPDTGERYLSTALFDDINIKMNDEEKVIADSTPSARFGHMPAPVIQLPTMNQLPVVAQSYVEQKITQNPVMLFSLEWCDFCLSLKNMLDDLGISYEYIDVDAMEHKKDGFGDNVKKVVAATTQSMDLPKLFIGGELIGGFSEFVQAHDMGQLATILEQLKINWHGKNVESNQYAPKWVNRA